MLDNIWWHVPQTVLYAQFSATLSLQDFKQMVDTLHAMLDAESSEKGVCLIIDVSRINQYARDLINISAMRSLPPSHPKTQGIIIITPNPHPTVRFAGASLLKMLRLNYSIVHTEAEAMAIIQTLTPFDPAPK